MHHINYIHLKYFTSRTSYTKHTYYSTNIKSIIHIIQDVHFLCNTHFIYKTLYTCTYWFYIKYVIYIIHISNHHSFLLRRREETDSGIRRKKHSAAPPGIEPRVFRFVHGRSRPLSYETTTEAYVWVLPLHQLPVSALRGDQYAPAYKHEVTSDKSLDFFK